MCARSPAHGTRQMMSGDQHPPRRHPVPTAVFTAHPRAAGRFVVPSRMPPASRPGSRATPGPNAASESPGREGALEQQHQCHEPELSDLHSDIEAQERQRHFGTRQASAGEPLAKPKPCSRPNAKATTQGWRMVKLVSPRHMRTISGPRNRMLSAIAALSGATGRLASPAWRARASRCARP